MIVLQRMAVAWALVATFGPYMTSADAAALTCPDMAAAVRSGTGPLLSDWFAGADDMTASNRLAELMTNLRESGMKPALIVDRLIGEYCPLVASDSALSDKQKADRVRQFARLVTALAYVPSDPGEVDVFIQTTVTPSLLIQIEEAARRAGMSRGVWIERAITRQLAAQ